MSATWWSQPFAPEGSATAGGILRQLGRPGLDELTILVREAAQNSWDARIGDNVSFGVAFERLGNRAHAWQTIGMPPRTPEELRYNSESWIIRVFDRGTYGLRGPVRASERPGMGEGNDFVQFLRNVGEPRDSNLGGGTYGFGKGIFYRMSKASAIIVDSRVSTPRGLERRVMGAALGEDYYDGDLRYTGRHWWGRIASDGIPDPITGEEAGSIADRLGFPGFSGQETGSEIAVVLPDFGAYMLDDSDVPLDRTAEDAGKYVASALLWNLWPKMTGASPAMTFTVTVEGRELAIPHPSHVHDLRPFVSALEHVRAGDGTRYQRSDKLIGEFNAALFPWDPTFGDDFNEAKPFTGAPRHVARMRAAELVVDYFDGQVDIDPSFCYGAVFRAGREVDQNFANAEPPTHDGWIEQGLDRNDLSVVRGARNWVKSRLRALYDKSSVDGEAGPGLGALATRLASLVPTIASVGAGQSTSRDRDGGSSPRGTGGSGAKARMVGEPAVLFKNGTPYVFARVEIPPREQSRVIRGQARVVLEGGGRESDPPAGERVPFIVGWDSLDGVHLSDGPDLNVDDTVPSAVYLVGAFVPDAVLRLSVDEVNADA